MIYKTLVRPLLFLLPPESVHTWVVNIITVTLRLPGLRWLLTCIYQINNKRLERNLFGLRFQNPVGIAAGFDKEARFYNELAYFGFGHVEIGTVTPRAQPGNPRPRLFRLPEQKALINRMGFNNHGVDAAVKNLQKRSHRLIVGGNIGKNTNTPNSQAVEDYCLCFENLFDCVDYFVVNVSCPNIAGLSKLQDKGELSHLLHAIQALNRQKANPKPILLKISPDLTPEQLDEVIAVVYETGLSGIVATNTSARRDGMPADDKKLVAAGQGGVSGKPLQQKSTNTIRYLHEKSGGNIPIIAVGGIFTAEDALEKLRAGASLVQVYTGFIYEGPAIAKKINKALLKADLSS